MFPPTSLNGAGYGGGGNRTRVVLPQVWLEDWANGGLERGMARPERYETRGRLRLAEGSFA